MVPCLAPGEGAEGSVVIIAVVEGTSTAMGVVVVVSAAAGAKGTGEARAKAGEVVEAGDVARAVGLIQYMNAGEVGGAAVALVVIGAAVGVRN